MLLIGESLNASIPAVMRALVARNDEAIRALAVRQAECGAQMLDVNAAVPGRDEPEDLVWLVQTVQTAVELPLVLDSANPEALRAALEAHRGPAPILSSITDEAGSADATLSLAVEHDCELVALCMDDGKISADPHARFAIVQRLIERATAAGLKPERLYVDPLVMAIATDTTAVVSLLELVGLIRDNCAGIRVFCGGSNVSFGMPERRLLNRTLASMLAAAGVDAFLVNVRDQQMMATLRAAAALLGQDRWCKAYLNAYRAGKLSTRSA